MQTDGQASQPDRQAASIQIHPDDHVRVLLTAAGHIPAGHKIAGRNIRAGEPVNKYGYPIGVATRTIKAGEWIHSHNLSTALSGSWDPLDQPLRQNHPLKSADADKIVLPAAFSGYRRTDNQIGIRNEIWIIPTVGCVNQTAEQLAVFGNEQIRNGHWQGLDAVQALTHPFGCSQLGDDHEQTVRVLASLAHHPNAAGVLVVGLGCENNQIDAFRTTLMPFDPRRVAFIETQTVADELAVGRTQLAQLAAVAAQDNRTACPLSDLVIGLKCGASDAFSGLTANPLLGRLTDRIVANGGSALLTETPEFFGAEQVILSRTQDADARAAFIRQITTFRQYYEAHGVPVYENPSPGNKAGGITTLEEKSLGCVQKAGTRPVDDVIDYGERVHRKGLTLVAGPGNDLVAVTALAAAGAQLILFTTGRGNPLGGPVPTIKIASNSDLASRKPHWIDFDAGPALLDPQTRSGLDQSFLELICRVASGTEKACNETAGYRAIALFKTGVTL